MSFPEMTGRVALVTGAAGGMGSVIASRLGAEGVAVALVDRDADAVRLLAKDLAAESVAAAPLPADVRSGVDVETAVADAEARLGPIEYLVNAAGVLRTGPALSLSDADWAETFEVNAAGVFHTSRAVVNRMVARNGGAVVTVASNAAATARTDMAAYAASKAAATMFTKVLGLEVARHGVRCNVVAPGSTDTPMLSSLWTGDWERASVEGVAEAFRVGIPLGKVARPADVADAVLFLLSDRAGHITMHDLTVDGGAALGH